jgi:hypothetical protein
MGQFTDRRNAGLTSFGRNAYRGMGEMRTTKVFAIAAVLVGSASDRLAANDKPAARTASVAVGAQYDSTHVYVAPNAGAVATTGTVIKEAATAGSPPSVSRPLFSFGAAMRVQSPRLEQRSRRSRLPGRS